MSTECQTNSHQPRSSFPDTTSQCGLLLLPGSARSPLKDGRCCPSSGGPPGRRGSPSCRCPSGSYAPLLYPLSLLLLRTNSDAALKASASCLPVHLSSIAIVSLGNLLRRRQSPSSSSISRNSNTGVGMATE